MNEYFGRWISSMLLLLLLISVEGNPGGGVNVVNPPPSPPPYPSAAPFKPSVVVVVCILTTIFSITFLLLLYAKHCKRATNGYGGSPGSNVPPSAMRKNSGVRRAVVESLPVFRFGSLRGPKDGLECAVCLSTFEQSEVLRLLPKCKHAFHVECVDTWLDAHSTCPLCRYRVDPEDILLIQELSNPLPEHQPLPAPNENASVVNNTQRVSGRHSSAGERGSINNNNKLLQIILQSSSRRSLDSRTKPAKTPIQKRTETSTSTSSSHDAHPHRSSCSVGFFEKSRKDGLLLASDEQQGSFEKRFEHRIMISDHNNSNSNSNSNNERWSDLQPSDLIYLRSEMIINDSRRRYTSARGSPNRVAENEPEEAEKSTVEMNGGRIVINPRSVSEIVGVSRRRDDCENRRQRRNQHVAGVLSRWLAWVSSHGQRPSIDHSLPL